MKKNLASKIIMVLCLLCFIATIFLPANEMFWLISISYFVFCIGYLTIKVNYLFVTTVMLVAVQFFDTYLALQGKPAEFRIYNALTYVVLFIILIVLISAIVSAIKKRNSEGNISFVIINIIVFIVVALFGEAYVVNTVVEKANSYFIWTFVLYLIPLIIVNSTKKMAEIYIFNLKIK